MLANEAAQAAARGLSVTALKRVNLQWMMDTYPPVPVANFVADREDYSPGDPREVLRVRVHETSNRDPYIVILQPLNIYGRAGWRCTCTSSVDVPCEHVRDVVCIYLIELEKSS